MPCDQSVCDIFSNRVLLSISGGQLRAINGNSRQCFQGSPGHLILPSSDFLHLSYTLTALVSLLPLSLCQSSPPWKLRSIHFFLEEASLTALTLSSSTLFPWGSLQLCCSQGSTSGSLGTVSHLPFSALSYLLAAGLESIPNHSVLCWDNPHPTPTLLCMKNSNRFPLTGVLERVFYGRAQVTLILILVSSETKLMLFPHPFPIPAHSSSFSNWNFGNGFIFPLVFMPLGILSSLQSPPSVSRTTPLQAPLLPLHPDLGLCCHHSILDYHRNDQACLCFSHHGSCVKLCGVNFPSWHLPAQTFSRTSHFMPSKTWSPPHGHQNVLLLILWYFLRPSAPTTFSSLIESVENV